VIFALYISTNEVSCSYDKSFFEYCRTLFYQNILSFPSYYASNLRGHFFAGYISLGAFLLTLKTFIIIGMKSYVYDDERYIKLFEKKRKLNGGGHEKEDNIYAPLMQLSNMLYYAIVFSLVSAIAQVSLGLINSVWAAFICVWLVTFSTFLLFNCLRLIKQNIDVWLNSY